MSSSDGNIYIDGLTTGDELSPFKLVTDSPTNPTTSIITPNTAKAGYVPGITSFVVGSDRLDHDPSSLIDTRMFFEKSTGAFRAGTTASTQWDNRGINSAAFGNNNIASGNGSFAVGSGNTASGNGSFAAGNDNTTNGGGSCILGNNNTVTGDSTIAIGSQNTGNADD